VALAVRVADGGEEALVGARLSAPMLWRISSVEWEDAISSVFSGVSIP